MIVFIVGRTCCKQSILDNLIAFDRMYGCNAILTGSFSLYLRGFNIVYGDVDLIVPGISELTIASKLPGFIDSTSGLDPTGPIYEVRVLFNSQVYEIWREAGSNLPIPSIECFGTKESLNVGNIEIPVRPLELLIKDYQRAIKSDYFDSKIKRDSYLRKIEMIEKYLS